MSWIKLHRATIDSPCFAHPGILRLWIWLLLKANFDDRTVPLKIGNGFTTVNLKRGQLLFGRDKAEEQLGVDGATIYKWMHKLEDEFKQIKRESSSHYTIVTICNYELYQSDDIQEVAPVEQPRSSRVAAEEQPRSTKKNSKEGKELEEYSPNVFLSKIEYENLCADFTKDKTDSAIKYLSDYKIEKAYKTKNDNLTIRRWVIDAILKNKTNGKTGNDKGIAEKLEQGKPFGKF